MKTNLSKINLNLLIAFDMLLKERHVTRSAKRLHLSQSAMSNILKQLRRLFQDELFVRGQSSRMIPTPRALELAPAISETVAQVEMLFHEEIPFNPETAKLTFTLALSDYTELMLLPPLVQYLERNAPGITIVVKHTNYLSCSKPFETNEVDMAIGMYEFIPKELIARPVFIDRAVCIGWNKNPLLKKPMSLEAFAQASHLIVLYREDRSELLSEKYIKDLGYERKAIAVVPHTLPAIFSLPNTNLICIVLERAAKKLMKILPLKTQPVTFKQCTRCEIEMVWHAKHRNHPAHRWLRDLIFSLAQKIE